MSILPWSFTTILDKNSGKNRFVTENNTFVYFLRNFGPHLLVSMLFLVMELEIDIPTLIMGEGGELSMILEFFSLLLKIFVQDCSYNKFRLVTCLHTFWWKYQSVSWVFLQRMTVKSTCRHFLGLVINYRDEGRRAIWNGVSCVFCACKGLITWSFFNPGVELSPVEWAENINDHINDFSPGLKSAKV